MAVQDIFLPYFAVVTTTFRSLSLKNFWRWFLFCFRFSGRLQRICFLVAALNETSSTPHRPLTEKNKIVKALSKRGHLGSYSPPLEGLGVRSLLELEIYEGLQVCRHELVNKENHCHGDKGDCCCRKRSETYFVPLFEFVGQPMDHHPDDEEYHHAGILADYLWYNL